MLNDPGLQNLLPPPLAAVYFAAAMLEPGQKLEMTASYVLKAAKRSIEIPDFTLYALGLRSLFAGHAGRPRRESAFENVRSLLFDLDSGWVR